MEIPPFSPAEWPPANLAACSQTNKALAAKQGSRRAPRKWALTGIAVVDIASIFKNYQKFKMQMDQMKQKVDVAENDIKKDQEACKQEMEQIKTYNASSPDYKKLEDDMLKKQGDLNLKVSLQKKDFMEQEGRIYFDVSREIDDAVKQLAAKNNITLVLRFNGDPVDPVDRNDILRGINKSIVTTIRGWTSLRMSCRI